MSDKLDKLVKDAEKYAVDGNWKMAFDRLADAHKIKPQDLNILTGLAHCAIQLGQKEEALTFFEQAVLLAPDSADIHNNLGVVQALLGKVEEAEGSYQMAITLDPDNSQAWKNLAMLYLSQDTLVGEGVKILYAVVQADPEDADGWFLLGQCYEEVGDIVSAKAFYEKVLSLNPEYVMATQSLKRISEVLPVEAGAELPPPVDVARIARPEHAQKLASLRGLAPKKGAAEPAMQKVSIAFYGPPELTSEMRLSPPASALFQSGMQVKLSLHMDAGDLQTQQVFLFADPHYSSELTGAAQQALQSRKDHPGRRVIIDLDQDFFSLPSGAPQKIKEGPGSKEALKNLEALLKDADLVTIPGEALAEVYKKFAKRVEVVPHSWSAAGTLWDKPAPKRKSVNLGVVSTHTSQEDAAALVKALERLLGEEKDAMLVVGGDISLAEAFGAISDERKMYVPFGQVKDYPFLLANFDVLLLPYAANDYNQHRSDVPLMEAGIRRIPWIANPNPAFRAWSSGGIFQESGQDWYEALKTIVKDARKRAELGQAGRSKADERRAEKVMARWQDILSG